jgi:hypothetical protein
MSSGLDLHPLNEPVHDVGVPDQPYRDNAMFSFWDPAASVWCMIHCSTSPNLEGRRARCTISVDGRTAEVIEPLQRDSLSSPSIHYGLGEAFRVSTREISVNVTADLRFRTADYSGGSVIPTMVEDHPLQHFQQGVRVTGEVRVRDDVRRVNGFGFRDRTWGFREESTMLSEYVAILTCFETFDLTAMIFRDTAGRELTHGFVLSGGDPVEVHRISEVVRDPAGLFVGAELGLADGSTRTLRTTARHPGFWMPMGWERTGPAIASYDDYVSLTCTDPSGAAENGGGFVEQAVVRTLG